jgi:exopolysaccharide biosynthesis predicted pyruvyltransferase EpsI
MKATYISKNREKVLNRLFEEYSKYRLIITDRFHGVIFSLITNTPAIVLPTNDHKVIAGLKWFPEQYREYIRYVDDIKNVKNVVEEIYEKDYKNIKLPEYFKENYYNKLKKILKD